MGIKLFKDLKRPLTHRELDENFETLSSSSSKVVLGPTMTVSSAFNSIPNTRKFVGQRPQSGYSVSYTYAKDADLMFRKGAFYSGFFVDEEGNYIKPLCVKGWHRSNISSDGKWMITVECRSNIYITDVKTGTTTKFSSDSFWDDTYINCVGGFLVDGDDIYIPGYGNKASHYILKLKLNHDNGELTPVDRISTGRTFGASYIVCGKNQIGVSGNEDYVKDINIYNIRTGKTRNISYSNSADNDKKLFPIGFDSHGKVHSICVDKDTKIISDINNIYVENKDSVVPHPVPQVISNQLAAFGEIYSYNWTYISFTLMELEVGNIYTSFLSGYDQSPTVFYNPDTFEFASLSDQNEALFITKKA